jgi:leucyl aminopeptidase
VTENPPNESIAPRPFWLVTESGLSEWLQRQAPAARSWLGSQGFKAERLRVVAIPGADGGLSGAVVGLGNLSSPDRLSLWSAAALADRLPAGLWRCNTPLDDSAAYRLALGVGLGRYRYDELRASRATPSVALELPAAVDGAALARQLAALQRGRDLINRPANLLGPAELAAAVAAVAAECGASFQVQRGEDLQRSHPLIAAVGQASTREPLLIDLRWGRVGAPRVTLVGKGVCFDSGGLDIKPSPGMALMKKDMGGAACALATAEVLMRSNVDIQLRLLIPAVENSVAGNAYRPGDVLRSRKGLTVEIGNTDAEGRLILADALADADSEKPELLVDFATLTGAARTALGPELPAAFSPDPALMTELLAAGEVEEDPMWPLPLWAPYDEDLSSKIADLNNVAAHSLAGAIFGGLFLQRFVTSTTRWIHLDLYAWNARERPGRPVGAEVQCARAVARLVRERFG